MSLESPVPLSQKEIEDISEGNSGALCVLKFDTTPEEQRKIENSGLRGKEIWNLFLWICNYNSDRIAFVLENCPAEVLKKGCQIEGLKGREFVENHMPKR